MAATITRPAEHEYAPFYAGYIARVPDGDIFDILTGQIGTLRVLLAKVSPAQADFRPGPAEWSIKEVVGHMIDTERVFAYRALRVSRKDQTPLPGFDQDAYIQATNYGARTLADLLDEFDLLRRSNLLAFKPLPAEASLRLGMASGFVVSARALIYMLAGHAEHHMQSLRDDYLAKL
jgi:hypothetical protein